VSIEHVYISDTDENYAPPEQPILEVGLVGDVAFLTIGTYEESPDERRFTEIERAHVSVPVADLVNALRAMNASQVRQDIVRANPYAKMVTANL
jgi:hypothetical protein